MSDSPPAAPDPMIDGAGLHIALGGRQILHGVSFTVATGDVFGFIGPNGAGKSTTIRTMLGLYRPDAGSVRVAGHPAGTDEARAATGFALDQDGLYDGLTAADNIAFFRDLYGCRRDDQAVMRVLDQVGLADRAQDRVRTFSRGMRQRTAIARALAHDPQVVVMDEPTSGVDPVARQQLHGLIADLVRDRGLTLLISSHDLDEIQQLCTRIALIGGGRIVLAGEVGELTRQQGLGDLTVTTTAPVSASVADALRAEASLGVQHVDGRTLRLRPTGAPVSTAVATLAAHGVEVSDLTSSRARLEQVFADAVADAEAATASEKPEPQTRVRDSRAGAR